MECQQPNITSSTSKDSEANRIGNHHDLILANREAAHRVGHSLIRRWGLTLPEDERTSAIDIALCEAAATYDPTRGTSLITWFFYSFKGELSNLLAERSDPCSGMNPRSIALDANEESDGDWARQLASPDHSPERTSFLEELRSLCHKALRELTELERVVVLETYLAEEKVAKLARRLGYSRGHLSLVKNNSARRLRGLINRRRDELDWESPVSDSSKEAA